jgi:hypothetical protein
MLRVISNRKFLCGVNASMAFVNLGVWLLTFSLFNFLIAVVCGGICYYEYTKSDWTNE